MATHLNIGCSKIYKPGYINIDPANDAVADTVIPPYELPYEDNSIDQIESYYLISQLTYEKALISLYEWFRILKEGGKLILELPNADSIIKTYEKEVEQAYKISNLKLLFETKDQKHKYYSGYYYYQLLNILESIGYGEIKEKTSRIEPYNEAFRVECVKPVNSRLNMAIVKTFKETIKEIDDIAFALPQTYNEFQEAIINILIKPIIVNVKHTPYLANELFYKLIAYSPKIAKIFAQESLKYNCISNDDYIQIELITNKLNKANYIMLVNKAYTNTNKEPDSAINYYMDLLDKNALFIRVLLNSEPEKLDEIITKHIHTLSGMDKHENIETGHDIYSLEIFLDKAKTLELMANKVFASGDLEQANSLYSLSIQLNPNRSFAYINSALLKALQNNFKDSLTLYNRALKIIETDPENDVVMLNIAKCHLHLQQFNEAISYAQKVHNDSYDKHQTIGCAYFGLGKYDDALEAFSWSSIMEQNALSLVNIGIVLTHKQKKDDAEKYFMNARTIDYKVNIPGIPYYPQFRKFPYTKDEI